MLAVTSCLQSQAMLGITSSRHSASIAHDMMQTECEKPGHQHQPIDQLPVPPRLAEHLKGGVQPTGMQLVMFSNCRMGFVLTSRANLAVVNSADDAGTMTLTAVRSQLDARPPIACYASVQTMASFVSGDGQACSH